MTPGTTASDSGRFRVTALNENGDTVYNRRYAWPAELVNRAEVDSVLGRIKSYGEHSAADIRARLASQVPVYRSFLTRVYGGVDKSTWVVLRVPSNPAGPRDAVVLDANGEPLGIVRMPDKVTPLDVDRAHLWVADRAANALVRLRLQATPPTPAPPARTAPASAGKAPARQ